ncbi:molybdopterin-guanine dinucleotide biosynthesis protein B [Cohnella zeiphila]|uniref:Molybdopterin-guanine dinucleotide biosynthesis protein B n=1 Tax=Cohnella zeiphila TaxID=2761120 RepID=A0A7X0SL76_9BACL|nr:molybdopterin-guanine dinucleotide biosynthesis protein B [Cohnella zeiphila]MBB6732065.1 molybdopterin-guanine dinucleotide biosynthesis protein B [Cohnella zeiphila]
MGKPLVIQVIGYKNSGKTTVVCRLVEVFKQAGLRVGTIKHDGHEFDIDAPETDTWKHRKAGADLVAITSAHRTATIENVPRSLQELVSRMESVDIVVAEGFKSEPYPKIVLLKQPEDLELLERASGAAAIMSWFPREPWMRAGDLPWLRIDETDLAAQLLLDAVREGRTDRADKGGNRHERHS